MARAKKDKSAMTTEAHIQQIEQRAEKATDEKLLEAKARFYSRVKSGSPTECWPWISTVNWKGYGQLKVLGKFQYTHRLAWSWHHGVEIPAGMIICHHCDNPPCCNPAHLFLGTHRDNKLDSIKKGRARLDISDCHKEQRSRTHCKRGHLLSGENIYPNRKFRVCKLCHSIKNAALYKKKKALAALVGKSCK